MNQSGEERYKSSLHSSFHSMVVTTALTAFRKTGPFLSIYPFLLPWGSQGQDLWVSSIVTVFIMHGMGASCCALLKGRAAMLHSMQGTTLVLF